MKNILFLFILLGLSVSLKAQTTICPPTTTCSQPGTGISVTAHVVDTSSNVNPTYAQSLNLNSPQRYFCLGDPIDLRGLWNPSIGLTDGRWDLISASCANVTLPAGTVLSTGSVTWPNGQIVSSSNQSRIAVPSQPGYYIFMFSGKTTNCPVVFDTAFVYVFPTFAANAGPNFIACDTSNLAGYAYMQELNSPQSTLPSGYIGTWEWASNSPDYFIDPSDINNPNAILHAKPLAYGSFTPSHWFRWKVENILTGCFSYDYVNIYFPNGQPVYAGADRTICSYGTSFQTNNCGAGECISNPGAGSVYWVPGTAYPSGYTTDPPSYFWWEFEGTYVAYPGTGYTLASPPTISYGGGYVTYFTAGLTGLGYPDTYAAGTYTIIYHVRGYCVEGDDTVKITFKLPEAITAPTNLTDVVMCNGNTTFTFTQANPGIGEYIGWIITPNPPPGLTVTPPGLLGNVSTHPFSNGTNVIEVDFPDPNIGYSVTYIITAADTTTRCRRADVFSVTPDINPAPRPWNTVTNTLIPPVSTSPDYVVQLQLPCGQSSVTLPYRVQNLLSLPTIYYFPSGTAGFSTTLTYIGYTGSGTPTTPTLSSNILSGLTLPGVYRVKISSTGGCGHVNDAFIDIEVQMPADGASAGSPVYLACGATSVALAANIPVVGTGQWSLVSYPPSIIPAPTITNYINALNLGNNYALATDLTTPGTYAFQWEVSNQACNGGIPYYDIIYITVADPLVTTTNAGPDMSYCNPQDVPLSAVSQGGTGGYWSTTTSGVTFANPNSPSTQVFGLPIATNAAQSYTFTWHLLGGCGTITDNVVITIDPALCCQASADPAYTHIPTNTTYSTNTILSGKLYVEDILTVNGVVLDITNVDMVFASCAGIHFINGGTIRANNSVFRACGLQDSWLGFSFDDGSIGIVEACSFKNAVNAISTSSGNFDIRLINNNFINCKNSLATDGSEFNGIITGNNFTVDQSYVNFSSCSGQNNTDYFGIVANSTNFNSGISQNNFVYSANVANNIFYGVFLGRSSAVINANKFSNLYRSVDLTSNSIAEISNNTIEISGWQTNTQHSIRVTELSQSNILGNSIVCSMYGNKQSTALTNAAIYLSHNNEMPNVIADNQISNFETGLQLSHNEIVYVTNNKINNCVNFGIYSLNNMVNASCNEIDMGITDREKAIGIAHINERNIFNQNNWANASFRSNCISECQTAIYIEDFNCTTFAGINNNFLYNYTSFGVFASYATLEVGSNQLYGTNSFVSNNYQGGTQAVDVYSDNCNGTAFGNFGILNVSNNIAVSGSGRLHSTASCAKQVNDGISHDPFNASQQFTSIQMCNEFDINTMSFGRREMGQMVLTDNWYNLVTNIALESRFEVAVSVLNTASKSDLDFVYNKLKNVDYGKTNESLFLEVVYLSQKYEYEQAILKLSNIVTSVDNEKDLKAITQIQLELQKDGKPLRNLSENAISTLTSIDAKQGMYAAKAKDLLQAANGKNDYRFEKTKSLSLTSNRDVINISEINLKVFPNPASNNLTLELVNASDENATISIFDAIGQRIYQSPANIKAGKISIDISSLAKGLYHVQLLGTDNKSLSNTFIKQ